MFLSDKANGAGPSDGRIRRVRWGADELNTNPNPRSQGCLRTTHREGGESLMLEKRNTVIMLEGGGGPELGFENLLIEVLEVITNKGRRYLQHWDLHQYIQ